MSGSGTNRLVQSALVDAGEEALAKGLKNANEVAIKHLGKKK